MLLLDKVQYQSTILNLTEYIILGYYFSYMSDFLQSDKSINIYQNNQHVPFFISYKSNEIQ